MEEIFENMKFFGLEKNVNEKSKFRHLNKDKDYQLYDIKTGYVFFARRVEDGELLVYEKHEPIKEKIFELSKTLNENEQYPIEMINELFKK